MGKGSAALIALLAACGGDEDQGPCLENTLFADFTDDFDRADASFEWGTIGRDAEPTTAIEIADGRLTLRASADDVNFAWIETTYFDMRERRITARIDSVPSALCEACEAWFAILPAEGPTPEEAPVPYELRPGRGMLYALPGDNSAVYDPELHRWWQIRASADALYFEVSTDGETWATFAAFDQPPTLDRAQFVVGAGNVGEGGIDTGAFVIDDLNLPPDRCD